MFEDAEQGQRVANDVYKRREPKLRAALLEAQVALSRQQRFPVLIVIGGVDGAGKGETVNLLNEWMDPRHIDTHAFPPPSDEERERPRMWRFWRALPARGEIGILFGAWHTDPILNRVARRIATKQFELHIREIERFEQMLVNEGVLLLKFWFHLSRKDQRARLKSLEKDPRTRWRVAAQDWERFGQYDRFRRVSGELVQRTSSAHAPWLLIDGLDENYRSLKVGDTLLAAMRKRLARPQSAKPVPALSRPPPFDSHSRVAKLELDQPMSHDQYEHELLRLQGRLNVLSRDPRFRNRAVVAVFEGSDAAGKGGAIRRVTAALDARQYEGIPIGAPTEEEQAHPYLWRFWRHLPRLGRFTLFDRSWYGRVLVERVEHLCSEADWRRAYAEINEFEAELCAHGTIVVKFWLQISKAKQLARFREREAVTFKNFKITADDWRNRRRWNAYQAAAADMVDRTSTELAPWTLVEANNKYFARTKVLQTLVDRIEKAL